MGGERDQGPLADLKALHEVTDEAFARMARPKHQPPLYHVWVTIKTATDDHCHRKLVRQKVEVDTRGEDLHEAIEKAVDEAVEKVTGNKIACAWFNEGDLADEPPESPDRPVEVPR